MSKGIVIWVMPIPFNVGHCRGITERFKSQTQHNSSYVVFSDSGKACYISRVGSLSRDTAKYRNGIGESTDTMNKERTKKKECYFFQGLQEGLQHSNTGVFRRVLCEGYNYTPYAFTTQQRATESHYNAF